MRNNDLLIKIVFWTLWTAIVAVCVFFIIHNAQWLIGDDFIVIRNTGSGKAFLPDEVTYNKANGRFFPFAYLSYNVLLLFNSGYISPTAHYVIQAVFFVVFVSSFTVLLLKVLKKQSILWRCLLALCVLVVIVGRVYPQFVECFSTSWCSHTLISLFLLFSYLLYEKQKWIYGIVALLFVNYLCYCGEQYFVFPLLLGICALLFQRNSLTDKEKTFSWLLICSALLFLSLYAILILHYIEKAYDGSHGESVSMLGNVVSMFFAQKIIVLAFVVFLVRLVDLVRNNKQYCYFDNLLLTAFGYCCGCAILKLNWTIYYNSAVLFCVPAILFFLQEKLAPHYVFAIMLILGLLYGRKIPDTIRENQSQRTMVFKHMNRLVNAHKKGIPIYWFCPNDDEKENQFVIDRNRKRNTSEAYLKWYLKDDSFSYHTEEVFIDELHGIWLSAQENDSVFPEGQRFFDDSQMIINTCGIRGYLRK